MQIKTKTAFLAMSEFMKKINSSQEQIKKKIKKKTTFLQKVVSLIIQITIQSYKHLPWQT